MQEELEMWNIVFWNNMGWVELFGLTFFVGVMYNV